MKRFIFYIDGFNFYFGVKSFYRQYYWIDLVRLFESFYFSNKDVEVSKVVYFTASPLTPEKNQRQSAFLNANKFLNKDKFEIVRGKYLNKPITCNICNQTFNRPEEKKTDVNISVRMIADCIDNKVDNLVLVSADTDLIPPLELITDKFKNKSISVYFPPNRSSKDIIEFLNKNNLKSPLFLNKNLQKFEKSIMPDVVGPYTIPKKWKNYQIKKDFI